MSRRVVVDTNVPVMASPKGNESPECQLQCIQVLLTLMRSGQVAIDSHHHILAEYRRQLGTDGQPGVGHQFMKWCYQHRSTDETALVVEFDIEPCDLNDDKAGYCCLPDELQQFDRADQKFVCVYIRAEAEAILVAVDSDWDEWADELDRLGVVVERVCG